MLFFGVILRLFDSHFSPIYAFSIIWVWSFYVVLEVYVDLVSGLELAASMNNLWISMVGILPLHVLGYDSNLHESLSGCLAREKGDLSAGC